MSDPGRADRMILGGAVATGAGFLARFGARIAFLFLAGQLYGPLLFGAFVFAVAVVEASIGFAGLSMKKMLFQFLDEHEEGDGTRPAFHIVLDAALLVLAAGGVLALAIVAVTAALTPALVPAATSTALIWLAPMIAGQALLDVLLAATRWKHVVRYEVIGRSIVEPYALVAAAALAWTAGFGAHGLVIGYWVGNAAVTLYALAGARRCFGALGLRSYRPGTATLLATFRRALPNTGTDVVAGIFARIDMLLVGLFLGERWTGIYGMAHQLRTPIRHVRQSFDGLLLPMVTRTLAARGAAATREALATASRFILAIQMPFVVGIAAIGLPLLELFGSGFGAGYVALMLLIVAEVIQGALGLADLLFVYRRPGTGLAVTAFSLAVAAAAGLVLIPLWGIAGAASALLLAHGVQAYLRRRFLRLSLGASVPLSHDMLPLGAGLAGLAAVLLLLDPAGQRFDGGALLTLLAGLAAYGAVLGIGLKATGQSLSIKGFRADAA